MSLEELRKAILQAKQSTVEKPGPKISTVEPVGERPKPRKRNKPITGIKITSDQLRTAYFVLFGKTTRKSNIEVAKEIIQRLKELLRTST